MGWLLCSQWLWWLAFLFLVPLFYCACIRPLSFKEGFIYGVITWILVVGGVYYSIIIMAKGPLFLRFLPVIFVTIYLAFFAGLWFWLTHRFSLLLKINSALGRLVLWMITSWIYFYWVNHYCLFLFNYIEGYLLACPLVLLAEYAPSLFFLPLVGKNILMLFLILTNGLLALPFIARSRIWWGMAPLLGFMPWIISSFLAFQDLPERSKLIPSWLDKVRHIPQFFSGTYELNTLGNSVQEKLKEILKKHPETELVVLPRILIR